MVLRILRGGWWSVMAGSVVEVVKKVSREFLLAFRVHGTRSDADVATLSLGKWWR
jgi:hypothetical protein